jgi:predicted nucleic acid-binding protein
LIFLNPSVISETLRKTPDATVIAWLVRFADRIFGFTEAAALADGDIMSTAVQKGRPMTATDGMIAAIVRITVPASRPGT